MALPKLLLFFLAIFLVASITNCTPSLHCLKITGNPRRQFSPGQTGVPDFIITRDANAPRAIQLIGIDSPGLTSCLAIAERVVSLAEEVLN